MKNRYLSLLAALVMLASGASCGSGDSSDSRADASSAAETTASTAGNAADEDTSEEEPAFEASELPVMDSACKVLDCTGIKGHPEAIRSCGNIAAVQCAATDKNDLRSAKYYIFDLVSDKLLRTIDADNSREILLGIDAEGTVTAVIWKDLMNAADDKQELVFYKPDGSRSAVEYNGDLSFLKYDTSGQLYDLGKGIARVGSDGSREIIFDDLAAEETRLYDPSRNRAVVSYLADSFSRPTTLMLIDTSTGEEIAELAAASDASVYGADDYIVVSCVPDYDARVQYISVYEKESGRLVWTCSEKEDEWTNCEYYDDISCGLICVDRQSSGTLTYHFRRVSDGASGTLTPDIPDAFGEVSTSLSSADRIISAVSVGDAEKNDAEVRFVMIDPAQINFDTAAEKCAPYDYPEKNNRCGDRFGKLRALADKLEGKYGIRILIGDEVQDINDIHDPYRFASAEGEESDEYSYTDTENALNALDEILGRYPADFFEQFRINGKGGLYIALVQFLSDEYGSGVFEADGVTFVYGLRTVIAVRADTAAETVDHEMFHAVESIVGTKVGEIDEDEWNALNPEGFGYTADFEAFAEGETENDNIYGLDDDAYFYRDYGKVSSLEDRATLIEGLFADAYSASPDDMTYIEDVQKKCPRLRAKYEYLGKWTAQLFGYVYWEKMLGIEL